MIHEILDDQNDCPQKLLLYHHYVFWDWQYYYRSSLYHQEANKFKYPRDNKDDVLRTYLVRHWSHRLLRRTAAEDLFDSRKILFDVFSKTLKYKYPRTERFVYHHIMFDSLDIEDREEFTQSKNGFLPIDFRGDIDFLSMELKVFYYERLAPKSKENKEKLKKVLSELLEAKVKNVYGNCSFVKEKQDKPRAVGIFLWDYVFRKGFAHGSKAAAYKEFKRFLEKDKFPSTTTGRDPHTLRAYLARTHEQILTNKMMLMTPLPKQRALSPKKGG